MRRKDESKKSVILDFIDEYYNEYNEIPAVRTIAEGTGIALATVHRYRQRSCKSVMEENQEIRTFDGAVVKNFSFP